MFTVTSLNIKHGQDNGLGPLRSAEQVNRVTAELEGLVNWSPRTERVVKADRELESGVVGDLLSHTDYVRDPRCKSNGLRFGITGIQEHAFESIAEKIEEILQGLRRNNNSVTCGILERKTIDVAVTAEMNNSRLLIKQSPSEISWAWCPYRIGSSAESVGAIPGLGSAQARQEGLPSRLRLRSARVTEGEAKAKAGGEAEDRP